mmetsp:Transcript_64154/g.75967  ORF Transcript_64154/g.75967 Transcript_64154/m.75967 type:complete len:84 (-) Transcript_64154:519-770(-)
MSNKSIYNPIPQPKLLELKHVRYRSKYDPNAPFTSSTFRLHGTTATISQGIHDLKKVSSVSSAFRHSLSSTRCSLPPSRIPST